MLADALDKIKKRKNFYRDCYFYALNLLFFNFSIIIVLGMVTIFLALTRVEPHYYATSISGITTPLSALKQPNYSSTPLIE